jgi:hypothetical protein
MTDQRIMEIAEAQIDWIVEKYNDSRVSGRLALLSVLMALRDERANEIQQGNRQIRVW